MKGKITKEKNLSVDLKSLTEVEIAAGDHIKFWKKQGNSHLSNNIHRMRCKNDFVSGAAWLKEEALKFINDQDNHTEGELGISCIDVNTLIHFLTNK